MRVSVTTAILLAASGLAPIAPAQQTPAPLREAGVITGRVLGDDSRPLVNATVSAYEAEARGPNRISRSTTTDDEGSFRLIELPPGEYQLSASAVGYMWPLVRATGRPDQNHPYFRPGASVTITLRKGGVIMGRVTDAEERAVVAVPVSLEYVRDDSDRPMARASVMKEGWTDDRGVYRIFGLAPGSYLVRAGGGRQRDRGISAFDTDAPTYHPSATRETAAEVRVRMGEEATGIDIRYRGEHGHTISGIVAGAADLHRAPYVRLTNMAGGVQVGFTYARLENQSLRFTFEGLPDGEYELIAGRNASGEEDHGAASPPQRVPISGADVKGIELRLIPLSSLSGHLVIAPGIAPCQPQPHRRLMDVSLIVRRDGATQPAPTQDRPDQQGEFVLRELEAGRYRMTVWLPHAGWYLRAVTLTGPVSRSRLPPQAPQPSMDASRQGFMLRPGVRTTGLTVTLAEGAAGLYGRVVPAAEGAHLPGRLRVHLIPAEAALANEVLRYAETSTHNDGSFALPNLAPGRYWLLARSAPDDEPSDLPVRPAAWDAESRATLRREAEAEKAEVALQACQRLSGHVLRYASIRP